MKKIVFFVILSVISASTFAQTTLLSEDFDGVTVNNLPSGWSNLTLLATPANAFWETTSSNPNSSPNTAVLNVPSGNSADFLPTIVALSSTSVSTTGFNSITVSWEGRNDIGTQVALQYSIDGGLSFLTDATYSPTATSGSYLTQTATLPQADNQSSLIVRWFMNTTADGSAYYIDDVLVEGTASTFSVYYSINSSNTNLENLSSWSSTQDEMGLNPPNFTDTGVTFIIDDAGSTFGSDWPSSGSLERVSIENGADLTIPSGSVLSGTVDIENGGELILENSVLPTFGSIGVSSTVAYNQGGSITVVREDYGNLTISNSGTYQAHNATLVNGTLNLQSGTLVLPTGTTESFTINGNITSTTGTITGSSTSNLTLTGTADVEALIFTSGSQLLRQLSITKSGGTITLASDLTINNDLSITSANLDVGSNTLTLNSNTNVSSGAIESNVDGTVVFNQPSDGQNVPAGTYGNLTFDNFNKTLASSGTTSVAGTFMPGTATGHTITGSTILFNGTAQTIPDFTYNNLTINGGTSVTAGDFDIEGDFTNNGTFDAGSGLVTFGGSTAQTIIGTVGFNNIQMDNNVNNDGAMSLVGILTLGSAVTFDADGSTDIGTFTLSSTASATATVATIPSGSSVVGNVTFERYIPAFDTDDRFRNFAIPLNGITAAQLDESDDVRLLSELDGLPNVFRYREVLIGGVDIGWQAGLVGSYSMSPLEGYSVYRDLDTEVTIDATGTLNQGNVDFGVTYTESSPADPGGDGWNFLGNPYPAPIDFDLLTRNGNVNATVSVWDAENNQYITYTNESGGLLTDGIIASGQSFWIQTTGAAPSLTAAESSKVASTTASFYRKAEDEIEKLEIFLTNADSRDLTIITFNDMASVNFDSQYDGRKLSNGIFNLSSVVNGEDFVANALPKTSCEQQVQLNITNIQEGDYTLKFSNFESISGLSGLKLVDTFLEEEVILENPGDEYNFTVTTDANSFNTRFSAVFDFTPEQPIINIGDDNELSVTETSGLIQWYLNDEPITGANDNVFMANEEGSYTVSISSNDGCTVFSEARVLSITSLDDSLDSDLLIYPNPTSGNVNIRFGTRIESANVEVYDIHGKLVYFQNGVRNDESLRVSSLPKGYYLLRISSGRNIINRKLIKR